MNRTRAIALAFSVAASFVGSDVGALTLPATKVTAQKRLSIPAMTTSAADALMRICRAFGVGIVVNGDLRRTVSVQLQNVTLDEALTEVLAPIGVPYAHIGNAIAVGTPVGRAYQSISLTSSSHAVPLAHISARTAIAALAATPLAVQAQAEGNSVFLSGPADQIVHAQAILAQIDVPQRPIYVTQFDDTKGPGKQSGAQHATPSPPPADQAAPAPLAGVGPQIIDIVNLKSVAPGLSGAASTTPSDVASALVQTMAGVGQEIRATVVPNQSQLALTGSPYAVALAKQLLDRLDTAPKLVVLDTQILEINETVAKNLGLSFAPNSALTTTYSETTPQPNAAGLAVPLLGLQPLSRTPLSLQFQLGLAISNGKGRVLADPRITTISGRTASIRAGDNLTVLTTTGGSAGTVATTQLQTFQTGVTLDITPVLNDDNYIVVTLHPVINTVTSYDAEGIPQIATRDTQTTVGLRDGQTLAIGGLIQDDNTRTTTKIPILGDLPLVGPLFRNENVDNTRDELIITVTPHVIDSSVAGPLIPLPPLANPPDTASGHTNFTVSAGASSRTGPIVVAPGVPIVRPDAKPVDPSPSPAPSPGPASNALSATNVFTFGAAPTNNYAAPGDAPKIYFASFSPTVLHAGANVSVAAVTTSNVQKVTIGLGPTTVSLSSIGSGQWEATYPFSLAGLPPNQSSLSLELVASKADGTSTTVPVPVNLTQ
jgi:type II secretory pathway component GspD/PulD (secretin)